MLRVDPLELTLDSRAFQEGFNTSEKDSLAMKRQAMKEAVQRHSLVARTSGKSLRAYLKDLAGYKRDSR